MKRSSSVIKNLIIFLPTNKIYEDHAALAPNKKSSQPETVILTVPRDSQEYSSFAITKWSTQPFSCFDIPGHCRTSTNRPQRQKTNWNAVLFLGICFPLALSKKVYRNLVPSDS